MGFLKFAQTSYHWSCQLWARILPKKEVGNAVTQKPSTEFEHQIERIHQLLEEEPSKVTWNDKMPDPDNPDQLRQIDIAIERNGTIIHVECRIHKAPQDVTWIEELIGRRCSLRVDAMIAVSSSGFTEGAIKKAAHFNIHIRTLQTLTDDEIRLWGNMARLTLVFYEFTGNRLFFTLSSRYVSTPVLITSEDAKPIEWRGLFEPLMARFDSDPDLDNVSKIFDVEIFAPLLVNGAKPLKIELNSTIRRISQPMALDAVLRYAAPDDSDTDLTRVQKHSEGIVEIIQSSDDVALVSDATKLVVPPNCFFHTLLMDFGRPINMKWAKLMGLHAVMASDVKIEMLLRYAPTAMEGAGA